jgi:hypothetical protein
MHVTKVGPGMFYSSALMLPVEILVFYVKSYFLYYQNQR